MPPDRRSPWTRLAQSRWSQAIAAGLIAVLARALMQPVLGDALPFLLALPACAIVAVRLGGGPGALAAAVCAAATWVPGLPPQVAPADQPLQIGAFAVAALITALLCGRLRSARSDGASGLRSGLADHGETPLTRWLKTVLWGAAAIPLTIFLAAAWWGYQRAFQDADASVKRVVAVLERHAGQALGTAEHMARLADSIAGHDDVEVRDNEAAIYRRLADVVEGQRAIAGVSIWSANGEPVASSTHYPVPAGPSALDRPWFQQIAAGDTLKITSVVEGKLQRKPIFSLVLRRGAPDGRFAGVISVSLSPSYFEEFYSSLATQEPGLNTFLLYLQDGQVLTRWPRPDKAVPSLPSSSPLVAPARQGVASGVLFGVSGIDGQQRLAAFQRVGQLPVYVSTSLSEQAILQSWKRFIGLLAAVLGPVTLGLVYVSFVALKKTRNEAAVAVALREEIRLRAQAEQAALQSQKLEALAHLTGGVAHDFNNLLAIVNGNVHLLRRLYPEMAEGRPLQAIGRATASGVRLTRQLLSFSRRQAINPEPVVLQDWLPAVASLLKTTLGARVTLALQVPPEVMPVLADTAELELALINLAVNARDAMPQGGSLHIEVITDTPPSADGPGRVSIRVRDSGTGMSPEVARKAFEPFFTTKPQDKGTGLGLSQVHGFCVQAGGSATIDSVPGQGTTVTMTLPATVRPSTQPGGVVADSAPTLHGRALLVEDNEEVAATYAAVLASTGLQVDRAPHADGALAAITAGDAPSYAVVVSDVAMPGSMDGIQFALKMRTLRPALKVILVTGYASRLEAAKEAGLKVLSKPVEPAVLFAEVEQALATAQPAG